MKMAQPLKLMVPHTLVNL